MCCSTFFCFFPHSHLRPAINFLQLADLICKYRTIISNFCSIIYRNYIFCTMIAKHLLRTFQKMTSMQ